MPTPHNRSRRNSLEFISTAAPKLETAVDRSVPDAPPAEVQSEYDYFHNNPAPDYLPEIKRNVSEFVQFHAGKRPIALVTVSINWSFFFFYQFFFFILTLL